MSLLTNLVANWKFDESSGNAADSSGNNNTLTNNNTITYSAGKIHNGANLASASSQYFSISNAAQTGLGFTGDFSFACWLKPTATLAQGYLFTKFDDDAGQLSYYTQLQANGDIKLLVRRGDDTANGVATVAAGVVAGSFQHVVIMYTAATPQLEVYVNSVSAGTSAGSLTTTVHSSTAAFQFGALISGGQTGFYNGSGDEAVAWSRILTPAEIVTLYNGGAGIQWPFITSPFPSAYHP